MNLEKISAILLFLTVFVLPLILQYISTGVYLSGNDFVENRSYITNLYEVWTHFSDNIMNYFFFVSNPMFIFFVVGYLVQSLMKWTISDD